MKNEKGFSLIVLVVTIIVIIILAVITLDFSDDAIDNSINSQEEANATIDDDKIKEIITYELAGTEELIDIEIDFKRVELSNTLQIEYDGIIYGLGDRHVLYLSEEDIEKVEAKTGKINHYKPYKDLTKSYIVDSTTGDYIRLKEDWEFKN